MSQQTPQAQLALIMAVWQCGLTHQDLLQLHRVLRDGNDPPLPAALDHPSLENHVHRTGTSRSSATTKK